MKIDEIAQKFGCERHLLFACNPEIEPYDCLQLIQVSLHDGNLPMALKRLLALANCYGWEYGGAPDSENLPAAGRADAAEAVSQLGLLISGQSQPDLYRTAVDAILATARAEGVDLETALNES